MDDTPVRTYASLAGELEDNLRRSIVEQVVSRVGELSRERRAAVTPMLDQLRVNGFRGWQEAPASRVAASALAGYRMQPVFWAAVFRAWLDLKCELRDGAVGTISELGIGQVCDCLEYDLPGSWDADVLDKAVATVLAAVRGATDTEARLALELSGTGRPATGRECPDGSHESDEDAELENGEGDKQVTNGHDSAPSTVETGGARESAADSVPAKPVVDSGPGPLLERLERVAEAFKAAAPSVRACAEELVVGGPPAREIIERLQSLDAEWLELRARVSALVGTAETALPSRADALVLAVKQHERDRRETDEARSLLRSAAALRSERPLQELARLQEQIAEALETPPAQFDGAWLLGIKALIELSDENVPDDRLDELCDRIEDTFGHALARAAMRRYIHLGPAEEPVSGTGAIAQQAAQPAAQPASLVDPAGSSLPSSQPNEQTEQPIPAPTQTEDLEGLPIVGTPAPAGKTASGSGEASGSSAVLTAFAEERAATVNAARNAEEIPGAAAHERSALEYARVALEVPEAERASVATSAAWVMAGEGEYALAHSLARALESENPKSSDALSPLLRGLVFAGRVAAQDDAAGMEVLSALTEADFSGSDRTLARARDILGAAVTLRPALLSRASGALGILQGLDLDATGNLTRIRELVARAPSLGVEIGPALLGGVQQAGKVRSELDALSRTCESWLESARLQKLVFAGATDTWHRLLSPGNAFFDVVQAIVANDVSRRDSVAAELAGLAEERQIERLVRAVEKEVRGRKATTSPVDSRAYQSLLKHVHDGLGYPRRWLELARLAQDTRHSPVLQKFDLWRGELLREVDIGRKWLRSDERHGLVETSARKILLRSLDNLAGLFSGEPVPAGAASSEHILFGPLLRVPHLTLDERWEPRQTSTEVATRILRATAAGLPSWEEAFTVHLREGRFLAVNRVFELVSMGLANLPDVEAKRGEAVTALEREKEALRVLLEERRNDIEQAVALDLLNEPTRLDLVSKIARYAPDAVVEFDVAKTAMDAIGEQLAELKLLHAREIAHRVELAGIERKDAETFRRIQDALERRDFPTATEYLDAHARGEMLHADAHADLFADVFFPRFVKECMAADVNTAEMVEAVAKGRKVGPVDTSAVPGAQREEAAGFLRAWQRAKQRIDVIPSVVAVLEGIGFRRVDLSAEKGPRATDNVFVSDLRVEEIRDRRACVIPQYGSLARGRYRLACLWGRPSEEELLSLVASQHAIPTIALYFGKMTEPRRRELARLSREPRRQLVVVDELLLLFLAMQRGARLPVMFRCAFPFTVGEPYVTSAGLVPREMFFGRERERQAIFDLLGTNLVYGGRQLGKTALLREVERTHHDPDRGIIVIWSDLKQAGIGRERPAKAVWELVGGLLEQHGVVKKGTVGFSKIRERVLEWLKADAARRIVVLLDEADLFLSGDRQGDSGQGYATLLELKRLLDESQKRFKFVLAGLHDVQRTSRDPNTPLAHLGSPLCIGPLMGDGEALEARALIEVPLGTLGYRFAHPDLPTRILSHTNYYPSLIQLFCWHLLDHVSNTRKVTFDARTSPPYVITAQHVDEAYRSQRLRAAIRDRFKWTLDLDPRYKLIALLIALESLERPEALAEGFTAKDIQALALSWWEIGFEDRSPEGFRTILDEMIGLGLLRKASEGTYALRSTNVVNLLGGRKEISEEIEATAAQEPPKPHEHPQLRRAEKADNPLRRSPLTLTQEGRILQRDSGVCVVFGARIAERDFLGEFLRSAVPHATVTTLESPNWSKVEYAISKQIDRKDPYAVLVVSATTPWTEAWAEDAQKLLRKRRSKDTTVRVVLLGDPAAAVRWCSLDPVVQQRLVTQQGTEVLGLAPWTDGALRAWFEDCQFGPANSPVGRTRVREVTGNWAALVHRFGESCKDKHRRWEDHLASLAEALAAEDLAKLFEIPPALVKPLRILSELQGADPLEDAVSLLDDHSVELEVLRSALEWASFLGFAIKANPGWSVDPLLAKAVRGAG